MARNELMVGFIGLGIMGGPMAQNVLKAGFELTVYNRTAARAEALVQQGAKLADSPADVARASDVVISCVTGPSDVLEVVLDENRGVIAAVRAGSTVVDCSTVGPSVARRCAQALAARDAGFLDAPVSGGDVGARAGTLSIMVGGDRAHFDRALAVLQAMGKTITYCGGPGAGYTVKLCNQILGGLHVLAAAEALALANAAGIDTDPMLQAVSSGAAGSWILTHLGPKMARGDYAPGFFVDYQLKDLRLASDAAHELGLPLAGAALAETMFRAASAMGHGRDGTQALYEVVKKLAGASLEHPES